MQSVGVKGRFLCNNDPLAHRLVELFDKEYTLDDNFMDTTHTDANGFIYFRGSIRDIFKIEPYLKVWHKCNYKGVRTCSTFE
ncbi:Transthyretin-like family protein [Ancylostoma duodenale]|uniref:Transthyretin-like family protein n=1 Tax=Ancylostoma duodenale TaxID=51022 RepID=A0A0C2H4S0_9BILA|nr:Transthyretin-like family protein [Ancylostoma duodenale]